MNLLIDIGNSRIKWLQHDGSEKKIGASGAMTNDLQILQELFSQNWRNLARPKRVLVSSVSGPDTTEIMDAWIKETWQIEAEYVKTEAFSQGVSNAYPDYYKLGVDRWMAIIAAWHRFQSDKTAICVVDCGTATTIDGISESGQHLGGFIIPGYTMMQEILIKNTSNINMVRNTDPIIDFSDSTEQGVVNGCYLAIVASIDRIVAAMKNDYGERIRCIITGGNAEIILKQLATEFEYEPELVLHGLSVLSGQTK